MGNTSASLLAAFTAVLGVTVVALWLSPKGKGVQIIGATATGAANLIQAATAPVTGNSPSLSSQGIGAY